jgi:hypothetical protein
MNDVSVLPGVATKSEATGISFRDQMSTATAGLSNATVTALKKAKTDPGRMAAIIEEATTPAEVVFQKASTYGASANAGWGPESASRMVEDYVNDIYMGNVEAIMDSAEIPREDQIQVLRKLVEPRLAKDPHFANADRPDLVADRTKVANKIVTEMERELMADKVKSGGSFDPQTQLMLDLITKLKGTMERNPKSSKAWSLRSPYETERIQLDKDIINLEWDHPYASEILRIKEIPGYDMIKSAYGIKGNSFKDHVRASRVIAKDPDAVNKAFQFLRELKKNGISDAKADVFLRHFITVSGMPLGFTGEFGEARDVETFRRSKLAAMLGTEITEMSRTVNNYVKTGVFKHIKAPMTERYMEWRTNWIEENAKEGGVFVGEGGELDFVNEILRGKFDTDGASWLSRQTVLDPQTGEIVSEARGDELNTKMLNDSVYMQLMAEEFAITMSKAAREQGAGLWDDAPTTEGRTGPMPYEDRGDIDFISTTGAEEATDSLGADVPSTMTPEFKEEMEAAAGMQGEIRRQEFWDDAYEAVLGDGTGKTVAQAKKIADAATAYNFRSGEAGVVDPTGTGAQLLTEEQKAIEESELIADPEGGKPHEPLVLESEKKPKPKPKSKTTTKTTTIKSGSGKGAPALPPNPDPFFAGVPASVFTEGN